MNHHHHDFVGKYITHRIDEKVKKLGESSPAFAKTLTKILAHDHGPKLVMESPIHIALERN